MTYGGGRGHHKQLQLMRIVMQSHSMPRTAGGSCSKCAQMKTEVESLCCNEIHRGQVLLNELAESSITEEEAQACVTLHQSFRPHMERGVLEAHFWTAKINWKKKHQGQQAETRCLSME